jgi:4-azaleucine resistance transporter AzlC
VTPTESPSTFTLAGVREGALASLILAPTVIVFGLAFGVLAAATGLSTLEAMFMSAWVNAGSAQMATLQVWADPLPLLTVCLTTLAMNARYVLLGASLRPWLPNTPAYQTYPALFVLGDGNWALSLRRFQQGGADAGFLFGSGFMMWLCWLGATIGGHLFGQWLGDPKRLGLDFFLAAFFATVAVAFFKRREDALPFCIGVAVAIVVERLIAGPWYIFAGAVAGSLVGALRHVDAR